MGITPPVIDDPEDLSLFKNSDFSMERDVARQDVLNKLLSSEIFEPRYLRPPPPLLAPSSNEVSFSLMIYHNNDLFYFMLFI